MAHPERHDGGSGRKSSWGGLASIRMPRWYPTDSGRRLTAVYPPPSSTVDSHTEWLPIPLDSDVGIASRSPGAWQYLRAKNTDRQSKMGYRTLVVASRTCLLLLVSMISSQMAKKMSSPFPEKIFFTLRARYALQNSCVSTGLRSSKKTARGYYLHDIDRIHCVLVRRGPDGVLAPHHAIPGDERRDGSP